MIALLLALQAATAEVGAPRRFSILADPCAAQEARRTGEVVVCGRRNGGTERLPLPQVHGAPDHPVPSNPEMIAGGERGSAAGYVRECGVYGEDCYGYGAGSVLPVLVDGTAGLAHRLFARKPDKRGRTTIDLDAPPPAIRADAVRP